ncbi:MAG: hypothetical protein RR100_01825, partial [Comamonas sp.]
GKWAIDINSRRILPLAVFMLKQQLLLTEHERAFHNAIHRVDKELAQQWDRVRRYEQHSIADDQWLKELAIGITTNMEAILKEMRWTETIKKPFETQSRQLLVQPMYKKLRAAQQTYENVEEGYWAVHQLCQSLDAQDEPKPEDLNQLDRPSSLCALWRGVHLKSMPLSAMTPAKLVPNATALICQP